MSRQGEHTKGLLTPDLLKSALPHLGVLDGGSNVLSVEYKK